MLSGFTSLFKRVKFSFRLYKHSAYRGLSVKVMHNIRLKIILHSSCSYHPAHPVTDVHKQNKNRYNQHENIKQNNRLVQNFPGVVNRAAGV